MTLPRAASASTCSDESEQSNRLWHAFELMAAKLLGDE
jgi:hypothetical protein